MRDGCSPNVRLLRLGAQHNPRPKKVLNIRDIQNAIFYTRFTNLDNGEVESWNLFLTPTDWHWKSGDSVHRFLSPDLTYERLFAPFQIFPGVVLPPGEYRFTRWRSHLMTAAKRRLQANVQWAFGTYWSGHADELTTGVTYKIPPRRQSERQSDIRAAAATRFYRPDSDRAGKLCGFATRDVFELDSV